MHDLWPISVQYLNMCNPILRTFPRNLNLPPTRVITLRVTAGLHSDLSGVVSRWHELDCH